MAHCLKGYLLLVAANPANRQQIAATLAAAQAGAATPRSAKSSMSPRSPPGRHGELDKSFAIWRQILDDDAHRPAGVAHLRYDLVPPWPDPDDPASRPTASRHAGRPICRATTAADRLGLRARGDRRLRRGGTRVDAALERDRTNYFAHHVKAHVLDMDCRAARRQRLARQPGPELVAGQQPDPSPLVASRADASSTSASATP